ncbi:hypothetical protein B0H14DRAFT_2592036 [Mycena olivaceomarginata]|nr:hypothetical protein B0H14DRAFT_2592036 [Mycena olivaceomarginata]
MDSYLPSQNCIYALDDGSQLKAAAVIGQYNLGRHRTVGRSNGASGQRRRTPAGYYTCVNAGMTIISEIPNTIVQKRANYCVSAATSSTTRAQLHDGATFSDIRKKNRELVDAKAYPGFPADFASSPYGFLYSTAPVRSIARNCRFGGPVGVTPSMFPFPDADGVCSRPRGPSAAYAPHLPPPSHLPSSQSQSPAHAHAHPTQPPPPIFEFGVAPSRERGGAGAHEAPVPSSLAGAFGPALLAAVTRKDAKEASVI